ncbi:MAG: protein translocase subunit SecF, partial [Burkholderiaceae bacterium]
MEFFRLKRDIPFMRHALIFNLISFATFAIAVFFLATRGLHLSIEFTGGTVIEVSHAQAPELEKIRDAVGKLGYAEAQVQNFGSSRDVLIRLPLAKGENAGQQSEKAMAAVKSVDPQAQLRRVEFVGPQVGSELAADGAMALLFVVIGIMIYLA